MADLGKAHKLSLEEAEQVRQSRVIVSRGSRLQPWIDFLRDFQIGDMGALPLDEQDSPTVVQRTLTTAGSRSEPQKSLTYEVRKQADPTDPTKTIRTLYFEVTAYQPKLRTPRTGDELVRRRGRPPKIAQMEPEEQTPSPTIDAAETSEPLVTEAIFAEPAEEDGEPPRRRK